MISDVVLGIEVSLIPILLSGGIRLLAPPAARRPLRLHRL